MRSRRCAYPFPSSLIVPLIATMMAWPAVARAQSMGLAPAQIVEDFKPGVPFQFELSTVNNGPAPVEMSVRITDFWYNEKNEKIFPPPGSSPHSAANWIQFVPERFEVPPNGTQKMKAIVTPPLDATGGYYAVLFVESKPQLSPDKTKEGKAVFTNMRIGCLVLLNAQKTEEYHVDLSDVKLTPPGNNQGLELLFKVSNGSNSHIFPLARLAVLDAQHKLVAKGESEMKRFLPGQADFMHVNWAGTLPAGEYTALLTLVYGDHGIATQQVPFKITGP